MPAGERHHVDVLVCFTPLCKIDCEHFETFFDRHGHGNSQGCINHGGILDDLDESRFLGGEVPVGCPHFPQEVLKKNRGMLEFHQAYGVLCYKNTGLVGESNEGIIFNPIRYRGPFTWPRKDDALGDYEIDE